MAQIDYDALAKQARGGKTAAPVDYDALANQARQAATPEITQPQTPKQIIQQETGIHPFENPAGQAAMGPVRAVWGLIRSPYDLARAAFASPKTAEEEAAEASGGHLGLALDRMLVHPAIAAHKTATELRNSAVETRDIAKKIEAAASDPKALEKLAKQYPQMNLSSPEKAREEAHTLTKQAIKLYVESVPADMGAIPIIGPMGQQAGERMAAGDIPGAITESAANAAMFGAPDKVVNEPVRGAVEAVSEKAAKAPRALSDQLAGIHSSTAAKLVDKTMAENAEAKAEAARKTAEAKEKFEAAKHAAAHETTGKEHAYRAAINAKKEELIAKRQQEIAEANEHNAKVHAETHEHNARVHARAEESHAQALKDVRENNQRIQQKYDRIAARRKEENAAAEHTLELRKQREAELQKETNAYYAKEDAVKTKAKAEENAAWSPWREKMRGVTIDGGEIAKPLEKIAATSPDVARTLRQLVPDPADAAPQSQYALDRKAIMDSQGITGNYWDLPEERRATIDQIAKSSGYEPEPIDFDPEAGVAMPIETIHRAQSILGRYIASGRYEGPVLGEMKQVYSVLKRAETRASAEHGALGDLEAARATTRKYQEAFGRERHIPRTQDEIREKQANPEAYKEREDLERLDAAKKHDAALVDAYNRVKELRDELRKMPIEDKLRKQIKQIPPPPSVGDLRSGYRLKSEPAYRPPTVGDLRQGYSLREPDNLRAVPEPHKFEVDAEGKKSSPELEAEAFRQVDQPLRTPLPTEPEPIEPEIKKIGPEQLTEANRKALDSRIDYLRRHGIWILGSGVTATALVVLRSLVKLEMGTAVEEAIGGAIISPLTVVGLNKVSDLLERPAVHEWLSRPTVAQLKELDRLPADQRAAVAGGLKKMRIVAKKRGYRFNPLLVRFVNANRPQSQTEPSVAR